MKKISFLIITCIIISAFVGCASGENSEEPSDAAYTEAEDETPEQVTQSDEEQSVEEAAEPTEESAESLTIEEQAARLLASMTLEEQIYQMFIVTPEQITGVSVATQAGSATEEALQTYPVGGIVYFADNIVTREQCSEMIANSQSYSKVGLFIAVDEEGGTVARIGNNSAMGTTSFPNMKAIGDSGDAKEAWNVGYTIGMEIGELGFNLDFAPVADVDSNPDNPVIGDRSFGTDAALVSEMVQAEVQGFQESGVLSTLKHFPGHGDTATDSHEGYTELNKTLEELYQVEFVPFQSGIAAGADFVMVGHISVPQVTGDDVPASLSGTMIDILKNDLGFDGLVITDSMRMEAITDRWPSAEAAVLAVQAGVDVILMPEDLEEAVAGIQGAVETGEIPEERIARSVQKILEMKIQAGIESMVW
ncbi:MAG: glycoside hydrolase family 3 protein [Lachnospiraceae bacterium]|nr:glycoside hydrolase family 3 protein [Lachnospiraceae bacterium]